jgi:hypothetical protein
MINPPEVGCICHNGKLAESCPVHKQLVASMRKSAGEIKILLDLDDALRKSKCEANLGG